MLYETLLQGKIFLCCAYFGILSGLVFEIKFLVLMLLKNNKIINIVFEIICMLIATTLFLICISKFNYGIFRIYELVGFCLGICAEYFSLHKLLEKNLNLIYNFFVKLLNGLKKTKLFGKIFK